MRRTQIYLPEDLTAALDRLAQRRRTTRADLIRLAARRFVAEELPLQEDAIWRIVGVGDAGPENTAVEHDRVLAELSANPRDA